MEELKMLKKRFYVAVCAFFNSNMETARLLMNVERIYEFADRLRTEFGMTDDELTELIVKAEEGGHYVELL